MTTICHHTRYGGLQLGVILDSVLVLDSETLPENEFQFHCGLKFTEPITQLSNGFLPRPRPLSISSVGTPYLQRNWMTQRCLIAPELNI